MAQLNLIDELMADQAASAYRAYRQIQHQLKLQGASKLIIPITQVMAHVESVTLLWETIFGQTDLAS
jgi:glutamate-ammonia-ligase adenylyltransferase